MTIQKKIILMLILIGILLMIGCVKKETITKESPINGAQEETVTGEDGAEDVAKIYDKSPEQTVQEERVILNNQDKPQSEIIKGYWAYSLMFSDEAHLVSSPQYIKNSGANLISIAVPAKIDPSGNVAYELGMLSSDEEFLTRLETLIKKYHNNNIKVMIAVELSQVSNLNQRAAEPQPFSSGTNLDKFYSLVTKIAEIAEKNKAEYFAPLNEPDRKLGNNYVDFSKKILPLVKQKYSGKIVLKGDDPDSNVEGYDILGISLSPSSTDMQNYRNYVKKRISKLEQMKTKEIWITEFGTWINVNSFSEKQKADAYKIVLEEAKGRVNGVIAYEPSSRDGWQIAGTEIFDVVKEGFSQMND